MADILAERLPVASLDLTTEQRKGTIATLEPEVDQKTTADATAVTAAETAVIAPIELGVSPSMAPPSPSVPAMAAAHHADREVTHAASTGQEAEEEVSPQMPGLLQWLLSPLGIR
jgi:hypothetical protein